jgi:hypothetical protein
MSSADEMEKPAKKWEVARLADKMENQENLIKGLGDKMDKMDAKQITKNDLDERLADFTTLVNNEVAKLRLRYDPFVNNMKKLGWLIAGGVVGLVVQIVIIVALANEKV